MSGLGRILIVVGLVLAAAGLVLTLSPRIPWLGKLPGDFTFRSGGLTVYVPLATCLLLSLLFSLLSYLFRR
ncbi:MAG: hypothetical protein B6D46_07575 [Polyangiaceae bacterium UTPRO1]|jgi:hypothetical protein|nr:DUF2905 domain-containing protein [Myxococcales bacterium]OQY67202.1 MAG: hypothetical protein B6D46_07575 [Polyangiaceae bacterium UTPRO1]